LIDQGHFWTGISRIETAEGHFATGQMSVQYQIPLPTEGESRLPVVLIHGGGGQGCEFWSTPDGRPGWAQFFLRQGHPIYVVDRPLHGRSPLVPSLSGALFPPLPYEQVSAMFTAPDLQKSWPQASLASQWPGSGKIGDPALDQFMAAQGPALADLAETQLLAAKAGSELLDRTGPAILITHSMGGPCGWAIAEARPDLVAGIVAIEPLGPPFSEPIPGLGALLWGLTASPMQYDPGASTPSELHGRPRKLVNLAQIPVAILTGEASFMNEPDTLTFNFLQDAGVNVTHLKLGELDIHGNGHLPMAEKNSDDVADLIRRWMDNHCHAGSTISKSSAS